LYIKIDYTVLGDGSLSPGYSYFPISGFYPLGAGIGSFISSIRGGGPDPENQITAVTADVVPTIENPCYVVFSVDLAGPVQFRTDTPGVSTDDDTDYEYFNLKLAADDPSNPSPNHIAYFRAISPSTSGYYDDPDSFNLYLNVVQNGTTKAGTIDPAVKNTGHDGGNLEMREKIREAVAQVRKKLAAA
jgi:hypothetical protein